MKNYRFNRLESRAHHKYLDNFHGKRVFGNSNYDGLIKCKLVHNQYYSVLMPDQIYIKQGCNWRWIQPLYFSGNVVTQFSDYGICELGVDISHGACLRVQFRSDGLINKLDDCSLLYTCKIKGPKSLNKYTTGPVRIIGNRPFLKLHHHTTQEAKQEIIKGKEFWTSKWNIQGTKILNNISYLYLTALPIISNKDDLIQIAMSSVGRVFLRIDSNFTDRPDLALDVPRESTNNRRFTLSYWVEASILSSQPCYRHMPLGEIGHHEVFSPFIHRIGSEPGENVNIIDNYLIPASHKKFDYAVVGDATSLKGLEAPYSEEETDEVLKVECIEDPESILGTVYLLRSNNSLTGILFPESMSLCCR